MTKWPDWGKRNPLQTSDNIDNDENDDGDDNGGSGDCENDVNNGDADDLVQSVKILCGLTVKVKPPDASEQLLNVRVRKKLNLPLHHHMIMTYKREKLIKMAKKNKNTNWDLVENCSIWTEKNPTAVAKALMPRLKVHRIGTW